MRKATPYFLLLPALLFTLFILVYSLLQNIVNSFRSMDMLTGSGGWVGLDNYLKIFKHDVFWISVTNSFVYALAGTLLSLSLGLAVALLLNCKLGKITTIAKFICTLPWVVSPVVAGFAWKWLLNDHFGILNHSLISLGVIHESISWLGRAETALFAVIVARIWQFFPFAMVMFLAGLQIIPQELYEAAEVDGASSSGRFFHITLPHLRPVIVVLLLLGSIWSFNDFNMVFIMTQGGAITASMVLPVLVREWSFVHFDLGKGSALSVLIFVVLLSLSMIYLKVISRRESL